MDKKEFGKIEKEKAITWAQETFRKPNNKSAILNQGIRRVTELNKSLEKYQTPKSMKEWNIEEFQRNRNDIEKISKSLKDVDPTTNLSLYKKVKDTEFGYMEDNFYKDLNRMEIAEPEFRQLQTDLKDGYGFINNFMITNLSLPFPTELIKLLIKSKTIFYPIVLHLNMPSGRRLGYLEDDKICIANEQVVKYGEMKIITNDGKQVIQIKCEINPNESAEQYRKKIKLEEKDINETFWAVPNWDEKQTVAELSMGGFTASRFVNRAKILIDLLKKQIPIEKVKACIEKMENKKGSICFMDYDYFILEAEKEGYDPEKAKQTVGRYVVDDKRLYIQLNHPALISEKDGDVNTLFHEFGHAVDNLLFDDVSTSSEFEDIYKSEKDAVNIDPYFKSTPLEFFAEAFSYLYSIKNEQQEQIKKEAPRTIDFIKNKMEIN
ncbi:hypothetical protein Q4571_15740 [Bacillus thuringiensis]|nr:hypothetical protein [Bacillus thuringiensis]